MQLRRAIAYVRFIPPCGTDLNPLSEYNEIYLIMDVHNPK